MSIRNVYSFDPTDAFVIGTASGGLEVWRFAGVCTALSSPSDLPTLSLEHEGLRSFPSPKSSLPQRSSAFSLEYGSDWAVSLLLIGAKYARYQRIVFRPAN